VHTHMQVEVQVAWRWNPIGWSDVLPCAELQIGMLWESPDWEAMGKYGDAHVDAEARVNLCTHAHTL